MHSRFGRFRTLWVVKFYNQPFWFSVCFSALHKCIQWYFQTNKQYFFMTPVFQKFDIKCCTFASYWTALNQTVSTATVAKMSEKSACKLGSLAVKNKWLRHSDFKAYKLNRIGSEDDFFLIMWMSRTRWRSIDATVNYLSPFVATKFKKNRFLWTRFHRTYMRDGNGGEGGVWHRGSIKSQ